MLQRVSSEPIEKIAAELGVQCPVEADVVSERQHEGECACCCSCVANSPAVAHPCTGLLLKYRADKMFKTWQPRIVYIEGLALVYKGKADGKIRGCVSLKDCILKPGPAELGEGSFVIKSGTPFPTELKDKKNRSFLQGRDYVRSLHASKAASILFRSLFSADF